MKQKILDFIKDNKGALSLFMIVFLATFIMGALAALCGAESLTQIVLAACCGITFTMGISVLEKKVGMVLGNSNRPAVFGIMAGVLITLI